MPNDLLHYYQQELAFIRSLSAEFAATHPKIAGRLRLGNNSIEDPHIARLIESCALLTARIHHKLDDDFPEIIDALLSVIYPHYQAPIPAMSIIQLQPDQELLRFGYEIPRQTLFATDPTHGEICYFRSCYSVTLWPITVTDTSLTSGNLLPPIITSSNTLSCLHLTLTMTNQDTSYSELLIKELQFFFKFTNTSPL